MFNKIASTNKIFIIIIIVILNIKKTLNTVILGQ